MRFITRSKAILQSTDGEIMFRVLVRVLFVVALIAGITGFLQVDLLASEIKQTLKQEANTLSAAIAADTYNARIQSSLEEYEHQLLFSSSYRDYLQATTVNAIVTDLGLRQEGARYYRAGADGGMDYYLTGFALEQQNTGDRIRYTIRCIITLPFALGGDGFTIPVSYDTYHIFKESET